MYFKIKLIHLWLCWGLYNLNSFTNSPHQQQVKFIRDYLALGNVPIKQKQRLTVQFLTVVPTEGSPEQTGQVYITIVLLMVDLYHRVQERSGFVKNVTKLSVFTVHLVVCVSFCSSFLSNPHTPLTHSSTVHSAVYYVPPPRPLWRQIDCKGH